MLSPARTSLLPLAAAAIVCLGATSARADIAFHQVLTATYTGPYNGTDIVHLPETLDANTYTNVGICPYGLTFGSGPNNAYQGMCLNAAANRVHAVSTPRRFATEPTLALAAFSRASHDPGLVLWPVIGVPPSDVAAP